MNRGIRWSSSNRLTRGPTSPLFIHSPSSVDADIDGSSQPINDDDDDGFTTSESAYVDSKCRRKMLTLAPAASLALLVGKLDAVDAAEVDTLPSTTTTPIITSTPQVNTALTTQQSSSRALLCAEEENRIAIFERVAPSVVYIDTFSEKRDVFSTNVMEVPIGSGSGYIWDNEGHIVTNFHVVQEAKSAQVAILTSVASSAVGVKRNNPLFTSIGGGGATASTSSGASSTTTAMVNPFTSVRPGALGSKGSSVLKDYTRSVYKARVIGVDPTKDIAVLKIDAPINELRPIEVGTSQGLRVGQSSLAIGNPFGLDHTLTTGVISGIGREVKSPTGRPISNVIQTDAAINPGNSGGPLLDSAGRMIGMATAIYSPSGASAGVGFAIPADTVKYVVAMLIENGQIVRPLLGVSILDSKQARQALGISKGVLILEVKDGTPAAKAGLRGIRRSDSGIIEIGDIIIAIEGSPIEKEGDLFKAVEQFKPGDVVNVTVNRPQVEMSEDGEPEIRLKELTFPVKLIASDDSTFLQK